ncbi:uncharacterized protein LOC135366180 [Ornithodoros turicata]|uniref:uncharacterized protein LOC135366180 n=1 Tax=Ornithodoros turicata TaxID=34597 RepID=UPI003138A561
MYSEDMFAPLLEVARRADLEIENAKNHLRYPRANSAAKLCKMYEELQELERQFKSMDEQLGQCLSEHAVVYERLKRQNATAEVQIRDTILKLQSRGVPLSEQHLAFLSQVTAEDGSAPQDCLPFPSVEDNIRRAETRNKEQALLSQPIPCSGCTPETSHTVPSAERNRTELLMSRGYLDEPENDSTLIELTGRSGPSTSSGIAKCTVAAQTPPTRKHATATIPGPSTPDFESYCRATEDLRKWNSLCTPDVKDKRKQKTPPSAKRGKAMPKKQLTPTLEDYRTVVQVKEPVLDENTPKVPRVKLQTPPSAVRARPAELTTPTFEDYCAQRQGKKLGTRNLEGAGDLATTTFMGHASTAGFHT